MENEGQHMDNNGQQWTTYGQQWTTTDNNGKQAAVLHASLMPFSKQSWG